MNINSAINQIASAIEYTAATLATPNQIANKEDTTVGVHRGRSFSAESQLHRAAQNIKIIESAMNEMFEIVQALEGSSGQWAEEWLNNLAKKCSNISEKFNKVGTE